MDLYTYVAITAELFIISVVTIYLLRRGDPLSPTVALSIVAFGNAWAFFLLAVCRFYPDARSHWWHFQFNHHTTASKVLAIYLSQVVLACFIHRLLLHDRSSSQRAGRALVNVRGISVDHLFANTFVTAACLMTAVLALLHFVFIDRDNLWHYTKYLEFYDPSCCGLRNPVLLMFHRSVPILGCVFAGLVAYSFARGSTGAVTLLTLFTWLYLVTITFALNSRFIVAQFALCGANLIALSRTRSRSMRFGGVVLVGFAVVAYHIMLSIRAKGPEFGFGIGPSLAFLSRGDFLLADGLVFMLFNLFDGGFALSDAFQTPGLRYPLAYKLTSFSPLPSIVDGYAHLLRLHEHRAAWNVPYGSFAESYLFGLGWLLAFFALLFAWLFTITSQWPLLRSAGLGILYCPVYVALFFMQSYQLRVSIRLIVGSAVVVWLGQHALRTNAQLKPGRIPSLSRPGRSNLDLQKGTVPCAPQRS